MVLQAFIAFKQDPNYSEWKNGNLWKTLKKNPFIIQRQLRLPIVASNTPDVLEPIYFKITHRRSYMDSLVANGSLQYPGRPST